MFKFIPKVDFTKAFTLLLSFTCILKLCNCAAVDQTATRESLKAVESSGIANTHITLADTKNSSFSSYNRHAPYGPKTYAFGFEVNDKKTDNRQYRDERRFNNGTVEGSYGFLRPDGLFSVTHYKADSKAGFRSETRTFDSSKNASEIVDFDLRGDFEESETEMPEQPSQTTTTLKNDFSIDVNHIDPTKDLLSPSLWNIVNGKVPLKNLTGEDKPNASNKLGFETFEKVIPKDFPLSPFALPADKLGSEKQHVAETTTTLTTTEMMQTPKPLDVANSAEKTVDWVSKIVNDTRKEFLENIPNLL